MLCKTWRVDGTLRGGKRNQGYRVSNMPNERTKATEDLLKLARFSGSRVVGLACLRTLTLSQPDTIPENYFPRKMAWTALVDMSKEA